MLNTEKNSDYNWVIFEQLKQVTYKWQIVNQTENIVKLTESYIQQINQCQQINPIIFLAEESPEKFLAIFFASLITNSCLFLINPHWQETEYKQIDNLVKPDLFLGSNKNIYFEKQSDNNSNKYPRFSGIMIPTGGTSGKIKFAIHSWENLTNSAQGFYQYFQQKPINSYCCLPLYHVSGLMQIIRAFISQGKLIINPYHNLKKNINNLPLYPNYFISLVPTQLKFILDKNSHWLAQFKTVLVGGASTNYSLKEEARKHNINLALTYGMTETASGISILNTQEFLAGNNSNGKILSHAEIIINSELSISPNHSHKTGIIVIKTKSLCKGYYPNFSKLDYFITDDIGYLDEQKNLYILGRNSQKIITGGENIFPQEIENVIGETGLVKDICVIGKKDDYWGEIIVAFYVPINSDISSAQIETIIKTKLANYKLPKIWYKLNIIPRNTQGKINYQSLNETLININSNS